MIVRRTPSNTGADTRDSSRATRAASRAPRRAAGRLARLGCAALFALVPFAAGAGPGPSTRTMSCSQAAALVKQQGAVVLSTSPTLYDRYVNDRRFCQYDQDLKPQWVPTRDVPQCFVGYTCYEPARGGGRSG